MTPEDDPTWPTCSAHPSIPWCIERRTFLIENKDAHLIESGMRYCVPIAPGQALFATVQIGDEIMPGSAPMFLIKSVPYSQDEEEVPIGLHSQGEGRISIADVLTDWLRSHATEGAEMPCPNSAHGFREQRAREGIFVQPDAAKADCWSIVINKMCMPCYEKYLGLTSSSSNFGLADVEKQASKHTSNQQNTLDRLRNRYS